MKHILYITAALAFAISCTVEPLQEPGLMSFNVLTGDMDPSTKGTLITTSNLTSNITAVSLYIYKGATKETAAPSVTTWNGTKWSVADYYWNPTFNLDIFARAPQSVSNVTMGEPTITNTASSHVMTFTYTIPNTLTPSQMPDILLAHVNQTGGTSTSVNLTLDHALSAVEFVTGSTIIPLTVNTLTLSGIRNSETCTFNNDAISWSATGGTVSYTFNPGTSVTENTAGTAIAKDANTFILIPQTIAADAATLTLNVTPTGASTPQSASCKLPAGTWAPGKKYTYQVNYQEGLLSISATVSVNDWTSETAQDLELTQGS